MIMAPNSAPPSRNVVKAAAEKALCRNSPTSISGRGARRACTTNAATSARPAIIGPYTSGWPNPPWDSVCERPKTTPAIPGESSSRPRQSSRPASARPWSARSSRAAMPSAMTAIRTGDLHEQGHPDGHDHAAAEALQEPEDDQRLRRPSQAAQRRRNTEQRHRDHPDPLGTEALGRPTGQRDHRGQREQVPGRDPLDRVQRRRELARQRLQSDVDDRRIEDRHDHPDDHDGRDDVDLSIEAGVRVVDLSVCAWHPKLEGWVPVVEQTVAQPEDTPPLLLSWVTHMTAARPLRADAERNRRRIVDAAKT